MNPVTTIGIGYAILGLWFLFGLGRARNKKPVQVPKVVVVPKPFSVANE